MRVLILLLLTLGALAQTSNSVPALTDAELQRQKAWCEANVNGGIFVRENGESYLIAKDARDSQLKALTDELAARAKQSPFEQAFAADAAEGRPDGMSAREWAAVKVQRMKLEWTPPHLLSNRELRERFSGASIIGQDETNSFLGKIETPQKVYSVFNPQTALGSGEWEKSLLNEAGLFGSMSSDFSPFNKQAAKPPLLLKDGAIIGLLSNNRQNDRAISFEVLRAVFANGANGANQ